jgi:hypothetical protein
MQIGKKDIENLIVNMVLKIKTLKRHKSKKRAFYASSLEKGLNKLQSTYEK